MSEDRRDSRAERVFERLHIPYTFEPDFALDDIAKPEQGTQVRANVGPRTTVDEYSVAYGNGAEFPPLVIHRGSKKLIDGNTRYAGATKAKVAYHPVYLVEAKTPRLAQILQGALNQLNGERLSNDQAIETARLMRDQGYSAEEIARHTGRRLSTVLETIKVIDLEKRAETLGLPVEDMSKNVKSELAGIQLDEPLRLVAAAVAAKGIGRDDVREIKNKLAETHSEAEAVKIVDEQLEAWEQSETPPTNGRPKEKGRPVRQAADTLIGRVERTRWALLADSDYVETVAKLRAVVDIVDIVPAR